MAEKRKRWRGSRALLNKKGFHSTAAIVAEIEDTSRVKADDQRNHEPSVTFQISDCDRSVSFDMLYLNSEDAWDNALHKVRTMRKVLATFEDALVVELDLWREREKVLKGGGA